MEKIKVQEIMSKNPLILDGKTILIDGLKNMVSRGISTIIVSKNSRPIGIVTDRDIVVKVAAKNIDPSKITLEEIMSQPLVVINKDDTIDKAAYLMTKKKIRKLPVVEGDNIIGILSENDILKIAPDILLIAEERAKQEPKEKYYDIEHFAGLCEICGQFSTDLRYYKGHLVCPECRRSL